MLCVSHHVFQASKSVSTEPPAIVRRHTAQIAQLETTIREPKREAKKGSASPPVVATLTPSLSHWEYAAAVEALWGKVGVLRFQYKHDLESGAPEWLIRIRERKLDEAESELADLEQEAEAAGLTRDQLKRQPWQPQSGSET